MKIAMLGTRGIPAAYSGFETAVENLAREFVGRGHEAVVYCRPHMTERRAEHVGARLIHLPTVQNKYLDTLVHSAVCTAHLATRLRPDVALYFIGGNAPVVPFARLAGIPSVLQIDGLDSERAKWPAAARAYLRVTERLSPAAATIAVTDSEAVADALEERFGRRISTIAYGARLDDPGDSGRCTELGIEPGRFVLFVGRLVPENNAHLLVEAHRRLGTDWPLVIVGDAPYAAAYIDELKAAAGPNVIFTGYLFGDGYAELVHRAGVMCVPTEVGGTHPVIIEGMAAGAPMLVSDHGPNLETVGDGAAHFALRDGAEGLAGALGAMIAGPEERRALSGRAARRARAQFSWSVCADQYLALAEAAIEGSRRRRAGGTNRVD